MSDQDYDSTRAGMLEELLLTMPDKEFERHFGATKREVRKQKDRRDHLVDKSEKRFYEGHIVDALSPAEKTELLQKHDWVVAILRKISIADATAWNEAQRKANLAERDRLRMGGQ
jgi:hypothetical protein